jgi:hypothetical protein
MLTCYSSIQRFVIQDILGYTVDNPSCRCSLASSRSGRRTDISTFRLDRCLLRGNTSSTRYRIGHSDEETWLENETTWSMFETIKFMISEIQVEVVQRICFRHILAG